MKIGLIKTLSDYGFNNTLYTARKSLGELRETDFFPDLVIGPDYGLNYQKGRVNSCSQRQEVLGEIEKLSLEFPETTFLLGSMPWADKGKMRHSSPMYRNGEMVDEFYKKRSNGEMQLAQKRKLQFVGGNCDRNSFEMEGLKFAYQICGDHGSQDVSGVDVEIIAAYDDNNGFYIGINNDSWSHTGLVVDGRTAQVLAQKFDAQARTLKDLSCKSFSAINIVVVKK